MVNGDDGYIGPGKETGNGLVVPAEMMAAIQPWVKSINAQKHTHTPKHRRTNIEPGPKYLIHKYRSFNRHPNTISSQSIGS